MTLPLRFMPRRDPAAPLLILFHEDGSRECETLQVGQTICPGAPLASLRGHFAQRPGWRHLSEPVRALAVLDHETSAIDRMAEAVEAAVRREPQLIEVISVGIGGGADAVLALLCRYPALFAAAILCRPRRCWSLQSLPEINPGNGVDVLLVTEQNNLNDVMTTRLMLSLAGHHTDISFAPHAAELQVCRGWLCRALN